MAELSHMRPDTRAAREAEHDRRAFESVRTRAAAEGAPGDALIAALYHCLRSRRPQALARLIELGADPNATLHARPSPAAAAAAAGDARALRHLLRAGAVVAHPADTELPALIAAARAGHERCVRLLLAFGADARAADTRGESALHFSAARGDERILKLLIDHGGDPSARSALGRTPVQLAAGYGHLPCLRLLLARTAPFDLPAGASSPLHDAACGDHLECLRALLAHSPALEALDRQGRTPLLCALHYHSPACALALLEAGARTEPPGAVSTALHVAALSGCHDAVPVLLRFGAALDARDSAGRSAVHLAAQHDPRGLALLVEAGANLEIQDFNGRTALWHAVSSGRAENVAILLGAGADPSPRGTVPESTPLHAAVMSYRFDCARLLLGAGADLCVRDHRGRTALETARWQRARGAFPSDLPEIIALLEAGERHHALRAPAPCRRAPDPPPGL